MVQAAIRSLLICTYCVCIVGCAKDKEAATDEVIPSVNDLRQQYTVSTLTAPFDGSGGAVVARDGWIYVANFGDQLNNADGREVFKIDPETGEISLFATGLSGPSGNTFDSNGDLIQANIRGNRISKIEPNGDLTTIASGLAAPVGVALDDSQNIYVCNCGDNTIAKVTPNGEVTTFVRDPQLNCPNGLTIDDDGNLYPVNFNNGNVFKITPAGQLTLFATIPSGQTAHIAFANHRLYVVGRQAHQLFEISLTGEISLLAGSGVAGDADGDGERAQFYIPNGIAISPSGDKIYVVDRVLSLAGSALNPAVVRVVEAK